MSINTEINRLLNFAKQHELISDEDMYYSANAMEEESGFVRREMVEALLPKIKITQIA